MKNDRTLWLFTSLASEFARMLQLPDWHLYVSRAEFPNEHKDAQCLINVHAQMRKAWIRLLEGFEPYKDPYIDRDGEVMFPLTLEEMAAHEVVHILTAELVDAARRKASEKTITELNERLTFHLAKCLVALRKEQIESTSQED